MLRIYQGILLAGLTFAGVICAGLTGRAAPASAAGVGKFDRQVAPLLARACLECHSPANKQGGLDLTTSRTSLAGGSRGAGIVPGKPEASWVWKRVAAGEMPPKKPLPAAEKALLKQWIAAGASWGVEPIDPFRYSSEHRAGYDWWSLQPLTRPAPPKVKRAGWGVNPIDQFVLAKLEAAKLRPSAPAGRRALIRRVYFDMLGLPPTPEEVETFVRDGSPGAYERLVDRVLASPHYGERWARHWLDVVRFGETQGFERNKLRPNAWKYRDWVVEALNSDLPYDEFIRLQIAGDVLRPDDPLAVIASGFLVVGPYDLTAYTDGTAMMRAAAREEELEGLVGTVTQTVLGLTVNCARCHDHKFDPISQKEYFRIAAALGGTYHDAERESLSPTGKTATQSERDSLTKRVAELREQSKSTSPDRAAEAVAEASRLESRLRLLAGGPAHVSVPKDPGVFHLLLRGDPRHKADPVAPGGITALAGASPDWGLKQDAPEAERRKALAAWMTDPKNPLTARVIVNRVWGYHFGAALVPTANDLGFNGGRPSHPELLDWLASVLSASPADGETEGKREGEKGSLNPAVSPPLHRSRETGLGWSLKKLHRLILTSATYRQASDFGSRNADFGLKESQNLGLRKPAGAKPNPQSQIRNPQSLDAENRLLWRQNPRRLEAEAFRDAVLAVSGELDRRIGGAGFRDWTVRSQGNNEIYTVIDEPKPEFNRRTLYRMVVRSGTHPFLDVLDCPDPSVSTPRRTVTTTPLQALSLLNSAFMERNAQKWAERLQRERPESEKARIHRAYGLGLGREPDAEEIRSAERFIAEHGLAQFCVVLLNTNEFLYVD